MSHVGFILPGLDRIGGAERQIALLAQGLSRRGWRVSVVVLSGSGGDVADSLAKGGIVFLTLEMRKGLADPRGWLRFHRWLLRERPNVVHAHLPHAAWLCRYSRLAAPMPALVDTLHSSSTGSIGRRLGYRWSSWLPDQVTAVSRAVADAHLSAGMVAPCKLAVLPNGVDIETWRPDKANRDAIRRELGTGDAFLWLAAGRLDAVKDYPTLLRAMVNVPDPAHLVIAGTGPLRAELSQLATTLRIAHRVRFLGFEPNLLPWMQAADGFVLSSLREGLPMALLEASACAVPVVATRVPGSSEVVVDGRTGYLCEPANSTALCQRMTALLRTAPDDRRAMGVRARQHVVASFSLENVLDRWELLYTGLLQRPPR